MTSNEGSKSTYEQWLEQEGLPITEGYGIEDVTQVARGPWSRMGGYGGFIQLRGTVEGERGVYVGEIPSGQALNPEKHLYEEVIYILRGHGGTEVWSEAQRKTSFEWGPGSLFSPPLNSWHRLFNGGRDPVLFLAVTNAPHMMDLFHNAEFIFNCDYQFKDRFAGEKEYFNAGNKRYQKGWQNIWETNFIPDVMAAQLDDKPWKAAGGKTTQFEISGNIIVGHIANWPVGKYHRAHYHGPGALIVGLKSKGYVLMWSKDLGTRPYENGHEDKVVKVDWSLGSIYSPPDGWFHQHFNTGREPARHLAIRTGSRLYVSAARRLQGVDFMQLDIDEGGSIIDYEKEDPEMTEMEKGTVDRFLRRPKCLTEHLQEMSSRQAMS